MKFIPGIQEWFSIIKSINVIHQINRMTKIKDFTSIDAEIAIDKIQNYFILKTLNNLGKEECNVPQYEKPSAIIILKLKVFLLKSVRRHGCPFSSLLYSRVLEILHRAIRKVKEIKAPKMERKK